MNSTPIEIEYSLPGTDLKLKAIISNHGQQPPDIGDDIQALLEYSLPATCYETLSKELRFGKRFHLCGSPLSYNWGSYDDKQHAMIKSKIFHASTWREAKEVALSEASCHLKELVRMWERRQAIKEQENEQD